MTPQKFVQAIKTQTSDAAVNGTIARLRCPAGRKPRESHIRLANWYQQLSESGREMLRESLQEAAQLAVFSFLCLLDGVSVIEDTPDKGNLELYFAKGDTRIRLNNPDNEELHNLFNELCQGPVKETRPNPELRPYDTGEAGHLKRLLVTGNGLEIHHVPGRYSSLLTIQGYDPEVAPAIALPPAEHQHIAAYHGKS
jgi:hypothetical protein